MIDGATRNFHFPDPLRGEWDGYRDPMADSPTWKRWMFGWFFGRRVRLFELTRDFRYRFADGKMLIVPAGYKIDGASVPQRLRHRIAPFDIWAEATPPHDFICEKKGRVSLYCPVIGGMVERYFTPAEAHQLWADMLDQVPDAEKIRAVDKAAMRAAVKNWGPRWKMQPGLLPETTRKINVGNNHDIRR